MAHDSKPVTFTLRDIGTTVTASKELADLLGERTTGKKATTAKKASSSSSSDDE